MDINSLREQLAKRRGQWTMLAGIAGVNRKTVERIVNEEGYLPTLRTMLRLQDALRGTAAKAAA